MQPEPRRGTRERILKGAMEAVARHGLAKLEMSDVSDTTGVSRGTLYRYFSNREELLKALMLHEAERFWDECRATLAEAPQGGERLQLLLNHATSYIAAHPALQRIVETDPALLLRSIQQRYPSIRDQVGLLFNDLLSSTELVRSGIIGVDQLVDWMTRLLISTFLIPTSDPENMARGFNAVYRLLSVRPEVPVAGTADASGSASQAGEGGDGALSTISRTKVP